MTLLNTNKKQSAAPFLCATGTCSRTTTAVPGSSLQEYKNVRVGLQMKLRSFAAPFSQYPGIPMKALALAISCLCLPGGPAFAEPRETPPAADTAAGIGDAQKRWTLNQQNADLREFIAQIAAITGESFVIDPRIKTGNTVSVITSQAMTKSQIYDIFLEVLNASGYTVVTKGKVRSITPNTTARTLGSTFEEQDEPTRASIVTRVIGLHSVSAIEVIPIIRPLIAQFGHAASSASGNAVVISDQLDNVERITTLVRELDEASDNDYEVLSLEHAWVGDIARIIQDTLASNKGHLPSGLQVIADERSNRLVIKGNVSKRARVRKLVQTLDKAGARTSSTRVIFLRHATAKNLAETLSEVSGSLPGKGKDSGSITNPLAPSQGHNRFRSGGTGKEGLGVVIRADEATNALVVIADPDRLRELEHLIRQLDIRRSQVLIEAAIVEVSGGLDDSLGLQWGYSGKHAQQLQGNNATPLGTLPSVVGAAIGTNNLELGSLLLRNNNFGVLVNALSTKNNVNLMSTPSLLVLDNESAEFVVGQEVPFTTGTFQQNNSNPNNPFNTVERKPVGLSLKVTPHIGDGQTLRLEIEQELSSLTPQIARQGGDPITTQRKIKTVVAVDNEKTVVLGGILRDVVRRSVAKTPFLGDIPVIGRFFTHTSDRTEKQNLMLFIKPSIVRTPDDVDLLTSNKYSKLKLIHKGEYQRDIQKSLPRSADAIFDSSPDNGNKVNTKNSRTTP